MLRSERGQGAWYTDSDDTCGVLSQWDRRDWANKMLTEGEDGRGHRGERDL